MQLFNRWYTAKHRKYFKFNSSTLSWNGKHQLARLLYLWTNNECTLGPFQGKVACTRIPYGKGVVGTCAKTQETQRIEDVHKFSGHIACDCASNSEICIPIKKDDKLVAILDIDSFEFNNFSKEDQAILEKICEFFIPLF